MPTAPIDGPRLRTSRDFTLPSSEGAQHFTLLALRHLEMVKGGAQFRSDLVEDGGWDLQVEMRVAQFPASVLIPLLSCWESQAEGVDE
jgi:hypothetical protein